MNWSATGSGGGFEGATAGCSELPLQLSTVQKALLLLRQQNLSPAVCSRAHQAAEGLTRALATAGEIEAADDARHLTGLLAAGPSRCAEQLDELIRIANLIQRPILALASAGAMHLLVVDPDYKRSGNLELEGSRMGLRVSVAVDLAGARECLRLDPPEFVLINLDFPQGRVEPLAFVGELAQMAIATLVMSPEDTWERRCQAAHAGAQGFLLKVLSPTLLLRNALARCEALRAQRQELNRKDSERVLLLSRDTDWLSSRGSELAAAGFTSAGEANIDNAWARLGDLRPDLLLIDIVGQAAATVELCRQVRGEGRWQQLPIVLLTPEQPELPLDQLLGAGADDALPRDIAVAQLASRLRHRLARTREVQRGSFQDGVTGVSNREDALRGLEQFVRLSERQESPFCLASFGLDQAATIEAEWGPQVLDRSLQLIADFLRRVFRSVDIVARWEGSEFLVGLFSISRDQAARRLSDVLHLAENALVLPEPRLPLSLSIGVAQYPLDGIRLLPLQQAASQALQLAQAAGGGRLYAAGEDWTSGPLERVDIALVDHDTDAVTPLLRALKARGWTVRWWSNSVEALQALTGRARRVAARSLILESQLPGPNGMNVLRQVRGDRVIRHILMASSAPALEEVVAATRLGVSDYLSKPYDITRILNHLNQALH